MQGDTPHRRRAVLFVARLVGLFAVFCAYVGLRINPKLFHLEGPRLFLFDSDFLVGFLDRPGGLAEYATAFLSPLFTYRWLGALVLTFLAAAICLLTRQFLAAIAGVGGRVMFLIPAVGILAVLGQYSHPIMLCVGLCVALVFANIYIRIAGNRVALRLAAFAIASVPIYYVTAGLYSVFACLCGLFELTVKCRPGLAVFCLLCAVAVPAAVGAWSFDLSMSDACRGLLLPEEYHWLGIPSSVPTAISIRTGLLLFFLVAPLVAAWGRRRAVSSADVDTPQADLGDDRAPISGESGIEAACVSDRPVSKARFAVESVALLVFVIVADVVAFDFPKRCLLEIESAAEERRWDDMLSHARRLPPSDPRAFDPRIVAHVNRALYFKGELLERMFDYPQAMSTPSLALVYENTTMMAELTPWQCSEILFDLGRINESHHMAYEALESIGERPSILKRLAYTHVIKGEPEAAGVFLALLQRSMFHSNFARDLRRQLDADPTLSSVAAVTSSRRLTVVRDSVGDVARLEKMLQGLLEKNPRNQMAFEYLMAHYLLTRRVDKLAANLYRFDEFGYRRLPRHCEEALVVYLVTGGPRGFDLDQGEIDAGTLQRFGEFLQTEQQFKEDVPAAFAALHPDFGDSYFFCYVFGHNRPPSGPSGPRR